MDNFERAEIYLKEVLSIPVELAIKDLNLLLAQDEQIPGLKIFVTGGQAIQTYFPNSSPLRTHDFDLKLVAPKNIPITASVRNRMMRLGRGCSRYIAIVLNNYINSDVIDNISQKYGLKLVAGDGNEDKKVFSAVTNLKNDMLNIVRFQMIGEGKIRTNSIADIYVVDPQEIKEHYYTFTGYGPDGRQGNSILSQDAGNYYIPFQYINGIPYAGLGYILWDTLRMIDVSKKLQLPKYSKYIEKKDAIIQALNDPNAKLSCNAMKEYILECENKYNDCTIRNQRFETVSSLINYAISEGLISDDPEIIRKIKQTYDLNYLCSSVKRML